MNSQSLYRVQSAIRIEPYCLNPPVPYGYKDRKAAILHGCPISTVTEAKKAKVRPFSAYVLMEY